jgi:hypothetical protein
MSLIDWRSPLGIVVIVLFILSVFLYIYGILKREKEMSFSDKKALVEERKQYLPKMRELIGKRLTLSKQIAIRASKVTLEQYKLQYLNNTWPYFIHRRKHYEPVKILSSLWKQGFAWDNLHYRYLKENDNQYQQIVSSYNNYLARIEDKKIKKYLDTLWLFEHIGHSSYIFALISLNHTNKIRNNSFGTRGGYKGKDISENEIKKQLDDVEKRITELERGEDL